VLGLAALLTPLGAQAQARHKANSPRIGIIWLGGLPPTPLPASSPVFRFRESLRELGWVEGRNLAIESRFAGTGENLARQVEDLVAINVDVIVAMGTPVASAARSITTSVPVVFSVAVDPVRAGLIESFARPGGNQTGIYMLTAELGGKRLALLHEAVPHSTRVAVLHSPNAIGTAEFDSMQAAAESLKIRLIPSEVRSGDGIEAAFSVAKSAGATALSVLTEPRMATNLRQIALLSLNHQWAAMSGYSNFAVLGGLMQYGANAAEALRRQAQYVDKVLKGARPADLPVEQSAHFSLVLNMKTAAALGLRMPSSLLQHADEVIK
jgi:putative tryptophan/tyrosine transport system substrate-binding protein